MKLGVREGSRGLSFLRIHKWLTLDFDPLPARILLMHKKAIR